MFERRQRSGIEVELHLELRDHRTTAARAVRRAAAREQVLLGWRSECSSARERIEELGERDPSVDVLAELLLDDPERLPADAAVAWLVVHQKLTAWMASLGDTGLVAAAGKVQRVNEVRVPDTDGWSKRTVKITDEACAEIAAALRQTRATVARRVETARDLAGPMRPLHDAMRSGVLSTAHVSAIREELLRLPVTDPDPHVHDEQCEGVLRSAIGYATTHTPAQARKRTRALVAQIEPVNSEDRRRRAKAGHDVWIADEGDDTALLCARMPLASAHHAMSVISTLANDDRLPADPCETAGQRRVTALMALLHHGVCGTSSETAAVLDARLTAQVQVVVSAGALAGLTDQPGYLDNDIVSAGAIRELIQACGESSTMRRLLTDPESGQLLDYGRTTYAIPDALRDHLTARDHTCRFPGCSRRAKRSQIDHAVAWNQDGETNPANTGHLCSYHHNLKTHAGWQIITSESDGACIWRSPQGRVYEHKPPPMLPVGSPDGDPPPF